MFPEVLHRDISSRVLNMECAAEGPIKEAHHGIKGPVFLLSSVEGLVPLPFLFTLAFAAGWEVHITQVVILRLGGGWRHHPGLRLRDPWLRLGLAVAFLLLFGSACIIHTTL